MEKFHREEILLSLYRLLISGQETSAILEAAAGFLNHGLLVTDRQCRLLFAAGLPEHWSSLFGQVKLPAHLFSLAATQSDDDPVLLDSELFGSPALLSSIHSGEILHGFAILLQTGNPIGEDEQRILPELCRMLSTRIWNLAGAEQVSFEETITELLEGRLQGNRLKTQLLSLGLSPKQANCLLLLQKRDGSKIDAASVSEALADVYPDCRCMVYDGRLLALLKLRKDHFMKPEQRAHLRSYLRENNLVCGSSNGFLNMSSLPEAYQQAQRILNIGLQYPERGPIYYLWEFAVFQMCDQLYGQTDLMTYCHPLVRTIQRYDLENHTAFLDTLKIYIQTGRNIVKTAECLSVHRNTVDYRLARISHLFDLDMQDPNLVYAFHVSFQILSYLECLERDKPFPPV